MIVYSENKVERLCTELLYFFMPAKWVRVIIQGHSFFTWFCCFECSPHRRRHRCLARRWHHSYDHPFCLPREPSRYQPQIGPSWHYYCRVHYPSMRSVVRAGRMREGSEMDRAHRNRPHRQSANSNQVTCFSAEAGPEWLCSPPLRAASRTSSLGRLAKLPGLFSLVDMVGFFKLLLNERLG